MSQAAPHPDAHLIAAAPGAPNIAQRQQARAEDFCAQSSIAVALCTCNGAAYLREQLDSLTAQTRRPDEVVIVDDVSTDNTVAIANAWATRQPMRVRVECNATRLGVTGNFERAISLCSADIICLADQDDIWLSDKVARLAKALEGDPDALLVHGDALLVDTQAQPLGRTLFGALGLTAAELAQELSPQAFDLLVRRPLVTGATCAIRRRLFNLAQPFDAAVLHDDWLALHAALFGRLLRLDEPVILYRQHAASVVGAPAAGSLARLRLALGAGSAARRRQGLRLAALHRRMAMIAGPEMRQQRAFVGAALAFARKRVELPRTRPLRAPAIALWWIAGRYSRLARGWITAVRDLLEPAER
jgi:hypothetical protein